MKINYKKLAVFIAIPLLVGVVSGIISRGGMEAFSALNKPPLSPPGWLFPAVWTILYILMGVASFLVSESEGDTTAALTVYAVQLLFNGLWSIIFFNFQAYLFAFIWLVALWMLILLCIILFRRHSRAAAWLLVPYLLWVSFAGYLNFAIYLLN